MANPSEIADLLGGLKPKEHGQTASASSTVSAAGQPLDQTIAGLVRVLQEHAGFRATDQQQRKLQHIFRRSRPSEVRDLVARIAGNPFSDELAALVEDLTNHETYFFRDRPQLDVVSAELLPAIIREKIAQGERRIRVWSAACATGEEAYTLAMLLVQALLDAGIAHESAGGEIWVPPEWTLEVLGTDISRQAVRIAREASYQIDGMRSFRQFPVEFLRFFKPPRDAYPVVQRPGELPRYRVVGDALRQFVRIERANLMDHSPPVRNVDLLLCRNVMIYIDQSKQPGIQEMLASALRAGGRLLMSPVDTLRCKSLFRERWYHRCLVYEKL